jgi:hypothetical protein
LYESELHDLIGIGRQILHEGCEQELCDAWRQRAYEMLCELLGPQHEYARLFQGKECCEIKTLLLRANVLAQVRDMVSHGHLPFPTKTEP